MYAIQHLLPLFAKSIMLITQVYVFIFGFKDEIKIVFLER